MGSGVRWNRKSLSLNTVRRCINATWNCIMQRGRHLLILRINAAKFSGPEVTWDGPIDCRNVLSVPSPHFSLFLGKMWLLCANTSLCDGMGVHQCPQHGWSVYMWRYHWCGGLCWNFGETYAAVKTAIFPRNFSISAGQCQASFCTSYSLPAVQICLLLKMYGASWRGESDNGDHGLLSSSSFLDTNNGQKFH